jgi:hypothetical protein
MFAVVSFLQHPYRLVWCLLALLCCSAAQLIFPMTLEVDLIFPRNDTYAPTVLTPVVFAVQNPQGLDLHLTVDWSIIGVGQNYNATGDTGILHVNSGDIPYLAYSPCPELNVEGTWAISWYVTVNNCSQASNSTNDVQFQRRDVQFQMTGVSFTTKNGTQQPDLTAATADTVCASNSNGSSYAFNITGFQDLRNACESIAPTQAPFPTPTPNPCGVKINPSTASSISSAMTSRLCAINAPELTCPPKSSPTKSAGVSRRAQCVSEGTVWLLATCIWLIYIRVL